MEQFLNKEIEISKNLTEVYYEFDEKQYSTATKSTTTVFNTPMRTQETLSGHGKVQLVTPPTRPNALFWAKNMMVYEDNIINVFSVWYSYLEHCEKLKQIVHNFINMNDEHSHPLDQSDQSIHLQGRIEQYPKEP